MPARANIVINDGQTTPVAHTFNPSEDGDMDLFEDKVGGIAIGFPLIAIRFRRPVAPSNGTASNPNNRVYRVNINVSVPTMESTSAATGTGIPPAPTVAYIHRANTEWLLPERGTLQERKNLRAYVYNLLANADILKVLQDLEAYW